jgi:hypothetical protein
MASTINADDGVVSGSAGVKTSADNSGVLELQSSGTTQLTLGSSSVVINEAGADVDFRVEGNGDSHLLFADANENAVGISTGGNAVSNFKLEVVGNKAIGAARFADTFNANGYEIVSGTTNIITSYNRTTSTWLPLRQRANQHEFYCDGVETARLDASGNLLVGTTTPALAPTVRAVFNDPSAGGIELVANNSGGVAIVPTSGGGVEFVTFSGAIGSESYTERARLDASGNLGVGTNAPQAKLHIRPANSDTPASALWLEQYNAAGTDRTVLVSQVDAANNKTIFNSTGTNAGSYEFQCGNANTFFLSAGGALVLLGGNTAANGTGITFPATQSASSNANTLDDYEEGSFTPTAVCTGQTITYTIQSGSYTKIGNIVRVQINIVINTVSGAAGGNTTISGLPFSNGDTTYSGQAVIGYNDGFANTIYAAWMSGTDMLFRSGTRSSGNDGGGFTAGGYIYINAVYRV